MPFVRANGIDICYELVGGSGAEPLLLISGHGAQLVGWDDDYLEALAARGFRVVIFDNRDCGFSTKFKGGPEPDLLAILRGDPSTASYSLEDMADDSAGLLDALGITAAHIVGQSMGGLIAQMVAIRHPAKTLSLCSIMSATGNWDYGMPDLAALPYIVGSPTATVEESIERAVDSYVRFRSPGYPSEEHRIRAKEERQHHRAWYPEGSARQLAAILASGDLTAKLKSLKVPTLVVHGTDDKTITPSGGEATARAIPGAKLMMIPGMGHDIPEPLWDRVFDAIRDNSGKPGEAQATKAAGVRPS